MTLISMVKAGNQLEMATGIHIQRFLKMIYHTFISKCLFFCFNSQLVFHNNIFDQTVVTGIKQ